MLFLARLVPIGFSLALTAVPLIGKPVAAATAEPVAAPVVVTDCRGGIASIEFVEVAAYDVTLHDTAPVAADEIRLAIPYGRRKTARFDLKGTFSPNVEVKRALRKSVGAGLYAYSTSQNECRVEYVHFADGTSWTRPVPATAKPS